MEVKFDASFGRNKTVEDMFDDLAPIKLVMARLVPTPTGDAAMDLSAIEISEDDDKEILKPAGSAGKKISEEDDSNVDEEDAKVLTVLKIGRSKDLPMDLKIPNTRLSSFHCELWLDHKTKLVSLVDTSTNGTFLNGARVAKKGPGGKVVLSSGDKVSLLNPATPGGDAILFTFQHLRPSMIEKAKADLKEAAATKAAAPVVVVPPPAPVKEVAGMDEEDVEEELQCGVCKDLFYKATMAIPCLHSFCGHCISEWLKSKKTCPECNAPMTELRPAHKLRSLVDKLLKAKPHLDLTKEEKADYDRQNSIPAGGKKIKGAKHDRDDEDWDDDEGHDEYSESDEEEDDEEDDAPHPGFGFGGAGFGGGFGGGGGFGFGGGGGPPMMLPGFAKMMHMPAPAACPQCHTPAPEDDFQCPPGQSHIACKMCHQVFPDRPLCEVKQRCELCNVPFCDLYLGGCKSDMGVGYLQPVSDHEMGEGVMKELPTGSLFNQNNIEIGILRNYLTSADISVKSVWEKCLTEFKNAHTAPPVAADETPVGWKPEGTTFVKDPTPDSVVCRPCCQRVFSGLIFHYRRAIPRDALPAAVAARPNCWFGLSCRTMRHNPMHAQNYNHICPNLKAKE